MAATPVKRVVRHVKPLLSVSYDEQKRKVLALYKAWYRAIPPAIAKYNLPLTVTEGKNKLREEFMKHRHVKDIRVIDMLYIKGQNELKELLLGWKQGCHIMYMFQDTAVPKPKGFLSKFLAGSD